jgi:hypothetical protein
MGPVFVEEARQWCTECREGSVFLCQHNLTKIFLLVFQKNIVLTDGTLLQKTQMVSEFCGPLCIAEPGCWWHHHPSGALCYRKSSAPKEPCCRETPCSARIMSWRSQAYCWFWAIKFLILLKLGCERSCTCVRNLVQSRHSTTWAMLASAEELMHILEPGARKAKWSTGVGPGKA